LKKKQKKSIREMRRGKGTATLCRPGEEKKLGRSADQKRRFGEKGLSEENLSTTDRA